MPLHTLQVDPGGEYLVSWARRKINFWHKQMEHANLATLFRVVQVSDGSVIYVNSLRIAPDTFIDKLRITSGGLWDFFIRDAESLSGQGGKFYGHFATLGRRGFKKIKLADFSPGTVWRAVRTTIKSFALVRDAALIDEIVIGWKLITERAALRAFIPAALGTLATATNAPVKAVDAQESKLIVLLRDSGGPGRWLSDGTVFSVISPPETPGLNYVLASANDGFLISQGGQGSGAGGVGVTGKTISLTNGVLFDASVGVHADDVWANPQVNFTDLFQFHLFTPNPLFDPNRGIAFYRNGILDYTTIENLGGQGGGEIVTRDKVHAFITLGGLFGIGSGAVGPVNIVAIKGTRSVPPSYSYVESAPVLLDANFSDAFQNAAGSVFGFTDTEAFLFVTYSRDVLGSPITVSAIINSAGVKVFSQEGFPTTGLIFTLTGSVNFFDRSCLIGSVENGTSFRRKIFFLFSDGTHFEAVLPDAALNALPQFICGSNTVAYAYVRDTAALHFLANSTGTFVTLPLPTRAHSTDSTLPDQTATSLTVRGFIEQKVGCRLLFEANWATAPTRSFHHWTEIGEIFNYGTPNFLFLGGRNLILPEPSSIHRMKLLELWNPA